MSLLVVDDGPVPGFVDELPPRPEDLTDPIAQRFYRHVAVAAAPAGRWFMGACWIYTGNTSGGYGRFKLNGKLHQAHRIAWVLEHGPIPPKLTLDHLCHEPTLCPDWRVCPHRQCVRYDHLGLVTRSVNATRNLSPPAVYGRATHCVNGHPLSGENLVIRSRKPRRPGDRRRPRRDCRLCLQRRWREWAERLNEMERAREAAMAGAA